MSVLYMTLDVAFLTLVEVGMCSVELNLLS